MKFLFISALLASLLSIQTPAQTFRSGTTLVHVEALVEENGHVLGGLKAEDFAVADEGQPQPVVNFAAESGSIRLVLLLDASGSMQVAARELAASGLSALSVLHPEDQVALMSFDSKASLRVPFTTDRKAVIAGVSKIATSRMGGGTDIYRALMGAAKYLGTGATVPNVILVLSDNAARSETTEAATLHDLWMSSATVDGLVISKLPMWDDSVSQSLAGTKLQDVRRIASQTGGVVRQTASVETELRGMLERSRTRYTVYFRQPESPAGTLHQIKVDLSPAARAQHPTAVVRARTAYYAE